MIGPRVTRAFTLQSIKLPEIVCVCVPTLPFKYTCKNLKTRNLFVAHILPISPGCLLLAGVMGETERVMWWSLWISGRGGVAAVFWWCRARRCYWWGREVLVVSDDREWTSDFAIIVAESAVRETPWRGGDWASRKPEENGGRSTVTVRDGGGWYVW